MANNDSESFIQPSLNYNIPEQQADTSLLNLTFLSNIPEKQADTSCGSL